MPPAPSVRLPRLVGQDETKIIRLHPLEQLLLAVVALHLIFLPWAVGGMRLWSQWISLGLGATSLTVALLPRRYTGEHTGGESFTLYPLRRLLRFTLFWIGLVFAAYMVIGALNPSWRYERNAHQWWMSPIAHLAWLPHGITGTPMSWASPARSLIIFGAAFSLTCALWVGITRRRSLQILLLILCVNAVLVALLALVTRTTGATKLYWTWRMDNIPYGPFVYHNHTAAWLNLMFGACLGLVAIFHQQAQRQLKKSSPAPLFGFFAILIAVAVVISQSRGGVIILALMVVLAGLSLLWRRSRQPAQGVLTYVSAFLVAAFLAVGVYAATNLGGAKTWQRFISFIDDKDSSYSLRVVATSATMDMWRDAPWSGNGAASFRYIFPAYQQHYPEIYQAKYGRRTVRRVWEFAHNDWAQMLAEYGVVGSAIALAAIAWWLTAFLRLRGWLHPLSLLLAFTLAGLLVHARAEFVLHNPAVLVTAAGLAIIALRSAEIAAASTRRDRPHA